jgi:hypothetical protein
MQAASDSFAAPACRAASDLYELACCSLVFPMLLLIHRMNSGFGLSVGFRLSAGFGFGDEFRPELKFGADSGFKFGFRFWVPRHCTRTEPNPLPSLSCVAFLLQRPLRTA